MRVAVIGGTGLIGHSLCPFLQEQGHQVTVISRSPGALPPGFEAAGVALQVWDPQHDRGAFPEGMDAVINLAGENIAAKRWTEERKKALRQSRVDQSGHVIAAMRDHGVSRLLQASAVGFYGDRGSENVDEYSDAGSGFLAELTRDWEDSVRDEPGIQSVLLRTSVVLTPEGGALEKMLPAFRWGLGGRLGSGRQYFPWIHMEDEVRAIVFLLEKQDSEGPYNLVSPGLVDQAEFAKELGRVLNRPAFMRVPGWVLRLVLGEISSSLLTGAGMVPRRLLEAGFRFSFPDLRDALSDLLDRS
jgi:uncharacterized protein (TIGR01777 family)